MFWGNQQETKAYERRDLAKVRKLDEMESVWNKQQQDLQLEHLNMSAKKKQRSNDFIDVVLSKCKLHGGPVTNAEEVKDIPKNKSFLRHEIQYQRVTHPKDVIIRPNLYKVNGLSIDEMTSNLLSMFET